MRVVLLHICILLLLGVGARGQSFPMVIQTTYYPDYPFPTDSLRVRSTQYITCCNILTKIAPANGRLVAIAHTIGSTATNPANTQVSNYWYQVDLPGTTSARVGYCIAGMPHTNPVCGALYITVNASSVFIRPTAGSSTDNVMIGGVPARGYFGQRFAVHAIQNVGGTIWYQIYLTSDCSSGLGWMSSAYSYVIPSTSGAIGLPTPTPTVSGLSSTGATLDWGMLYYPSGATFSITGTVAATLVGSSLSNTFTPTTYTFSSLAPCTIYSEYVTAHFGGCSSISAPITYTTTCCSGPAPPSTLSSASVTASSFVANWGSVSGATGYYLEVSTSPTFSSPVFSGPVGSTLYYPLSALSCNTTYYYHVKATNGFCYGSFSTSGTVTTAACCTPPSVPSALSASSVTASSFFANWGISSTATGYYIDVSTSPSFTSYVSVYHNFYHPASSTSQAITGLSCNTTYYYRVRAYNSCSSINSGTISVTTSSCCSPPDPPVASLAAVTSPWAFQAKWALASGATDYYLDVSTDTFFATYLPGFHNRPVGNTSFYSVTGLQYFQTYFYRVRARNSCDTSSYSITIGVLTVPLIPSNTFVIQQKYPSDHVAEPINVATGSYEYRHLDFAMPSLNGSLEFTRYYNSINNNLDRYLGYGWTHSYDYSVENFGDTLWIVHYGDGHNAFFIPLSITSDSSFALFGGTYEQLARNPSSGLFSLTFKTGEVYAFNAAGNLASITDRNGNVTTLTYTSGKLTSVTAPGGRSLFLSYTGSRLTAVSDDMSRTVNYGYDGSDNLTSVTDQNAHSTGFTYTGDHLIRQAITANGDTLLTNSYDSQNRVISQYDALHDTTTIAYNSPTVGDATIIYPGGATRVVHHDDFYRLTSERDELGISKNYTYDYNNNVDTLIDEKGRITRIAYDSLGNRLTVVRPLGITAHMDYNQYSLPVKLIDPLLQVDSIVYDSAGNAITLLLPDGSSRQFSYETGSGLLSASIDGEGHVTSYSYNTFGDLTSVTSPSGTKTFEYDSTGRLLVKTDENHHSTYFVYDGVGNILSIRNAIGDSLEYSYDADNNRLVEVDRNGNTTHYEYDEKDRLTDIIDAQGGHKSLTYDVRDNVIQATDQNGNVVNYGYDIKKQLVSVADTLGTRTIGYDSVGNIIADTSADGVINTYEYDSLNRLVSVTDALGNTTTMTNDGLGRLSSLTDQLGRSTSYNYTPLNKISRVIDAHMHNTDVTYDLNSQITSLTNTRDYTQYYRYDSSLRIQGYTDADGNVDSFVYDAKGNLLLEVKPTGIITRAYDSLNRLIRLSTASDSSNFGYDKNGNLTSFANATGNSTFSYDSLNMLMQHTNTFGDTLRYTRDAIGNITSITYPGGHVVTYSYNGANLMDSVTDWLGHTFAYTYTASGKLHEVIYPNGIICTRSYDAAGRLDTISTRLGSTILSRSVFGMNAKGERITENRVGSTPKHLRSATYVNEYAPNDHLQSVNGDPVTFDGNGNRLSETSAAGTTSYSYTPDNLLISVFAPNDTFSYRYDALRTRVERTANGVIHMYTVDYSSNLTRVLQEKDTSGSIKANYIYGVGLLARIDSSGNIIYYHFDGLHNTVALSNDSAQVVDKYTYMSSGKIFAHSGNIEQPFTFLGEHGVEQESSTFFFVRARYYDASQNGIFLQKDPFPLSLAVPQTANKYMYGFDNPLSAFDPSGLWGDYDNSGVPHTKTGEVIGKVLVGAVEVLGVVAITVLTDGVGDFFLGGAETGEVIAGAGEIASSTTAESSLGEEAATYTRSSLQRGLEEHKLYKADLHDPANGMFKEFRLPSGRRIDFLDVPNQTIYELKPYNPRSMTEGNKQLEKYLQELLSPKTLEQYPEFNGKKWKTVPETY